MRRFPRVRAYGRWERRINWSRGFAYRETPVRNAPVPRPILKYARSGPAAPPVARTGSGSGAGVNVVSAECTAEIDLRVPSQQLAEEMTHWFLGRDGRSGNLETARREGCPYQRSPETFGRRQGPRRVHELAQFEASPPLRPRGYRPRNSN